MRCPCDWKVDRSLVEPGMAPARRPAAWRQDESADDLGNAARKSAGKGAGNCVIPDRARYETVSSPGRLVVRRRNEGIPGRDPWVTGGHWSVGLKLGRCWIVQALPVWAVGGLVVAVAVVIVWIVETVTSLEYRFLLRGAIGVVIVVNVGGVDVGRLGMPTAVHTMAGRQLGIDRPGRGSGSGCCAVVVVRRRT